MNPFKVNIVKDYSGMLHIVITHFDGRKMCAAKEVKLEFEEIPKGAFFKEPTIGIGWHEADNFLYAWKEALEGTKLPEGRVEGELKATKYHLEDMRRIVFEDLDFKEEDIKSAIEFAKDSVEKA